MMQDGMTMGCKALALCILLCLVSTGLPQGRDEKKPSKPPKALAFDSPVTTAEVNATFTRVEKAIATLPGMQSFKPSARQGSKGAATRDYIILEMNKLFDRLQPRFKFTPRKVAFDPKRLVVKPATAKTLHKLIAWGCVARVGPLATGPKPTIGLEQYGDALGLFVNRIADLTHSPDIKFSPGMMERIGG
jgi:hypothetical protein